MLHMIAHRGPDRGFTRLFLFLATAAWVATVPNAITVRHFFDAPAAGPWFSAVPFALGGWLFILTTTFALLLSAGVLFWGRAGKVLCVIVLVVGAVVSYFSTFLGTQFDRTMLLNVLQTNPGEALELINGRMAAWVMVVGLVPASIIAFLPYRPASLPVRAAGLSFAVLLGLLAGTTAVVYAQYARYATAARNKSFTFHTVAPANIVAAGLSLAGAHLVATTARAPRGTDAHPSHALPRPRLLFFVLGETARAANHGLNGYLRETTPRMRAAGGFYFPDTESCGTATAISIPCMFSGFSRQEFSLLRGLENETLIDVVLRSGARVIWRDNDSGCKGVCGKAELQDMTGSSNPDWCTEPGDCFDEILLQGLETQVRMQTRDTLVVLHLKGSHGPAYYRRYPPAFERFTPVCRTNDLSACEKAALRNTYDNTILYTDHVVGEAIRMLEKLSDQFAPALLYVSDHGESLGESGLYLHGMPYAVAPKEQTRVPMYAWVSRRFIELEKWSRECMALQSRVPRTHDNVYATVLGFMDVETREYKPALDLFEPCDPPDEASRKPR